MLKEEADEITAALATIPAGERPQVKARTPTLLAYRALEYSGKRTLGFYSPSVLEGLAVEVAQRAGVIEYYHRGEWAVEICDDRRALLIVFTDNPEGEHRNKQIYAWPLGEGDAEGWISSRA